MKYKGFMLGLIVGALSVGSIVVADNYYNIEPNPYKILVNGEEKKIEGYNINDYSYFKLRDIGEQVGFSVDFKDGDIVINTIDSAIDDKSVVKHDSDTSYNFILYNGKEYLSGDELKKIVVRSNNGGERYYWSCIIDTYYSGFNPKDDAYILLQKAYINTNGEVESGEEYRIPAIFINPQKDDPCYITREDFENEVLVRINAVDE